MLPCDILCSPHGLLQLLHLQSPQPLEQGTGSEAHLATSNTIDVPLSLGTRHRQPGSGRLLEQGVISRALEEGQGQVDQDQGSERFAERLPSALRPCQNVH